MKKGKLVAITGPMFAGKTTYLIKVYGDGDGIVVFKPDLDKRYTKRPVVISHNKSEIPSVLVNNDRPEEMLELVGDSRTVLVDEVNFFAESVVGVVEKLVMNGVNVYVAGLNMYADGDAWGPMNELMSLADEKHELTARCDGEQGNCSAPATRSYRKVPEMDRVQVSGAAEYGAACREHYPQLHHAPKHS